MDGIISGGGLKPGVFNVVFCGRRANRRCLYMVCTAVEHDFQNISLLPLQLSPLNIPAANPFQNKLALCLVSYEALSLPYYPPHPCRECTLTRSTPRLVNYQQHHLVTEGKRSRFILVTFLHITTA